MKCFKAILIIILIVLVMAASGFTFPSKILYTSSPDNPVDNFNGEILHEIDQPIPPVLNVYDSIVNNNSVEADKGTSIRPQDAQESVDFMVSNSDLTVMTPIAKPGDSVYFKVRVHNNTPDKGMCGGSTARFIMNGKVIDEVPFFLKNGEAFLDVYSRIYLPEGEYSGLALEQQVTVQMQAIIDPYNKIPEGNEDNNSASCQFKVKGVYRPILQGINPGITVDVTGLSAFSIKNDMPDGMISAAIPKQKLYLKARIKYDGSATMDDINIKFVLNGVVIKDIDKPIYGIPASGYSEIYAEYYVPVNATEPLDFSVILSNGSQARIKIPVLRWDIGINKGDLGWSGEVAGIPGKDIYLKAIIKNITSLEYPSNTGIIGYKVLIDGTLFYENSFTPFFSYSFYPSIPAYKVPADRTTPIQYTFIVDSYDQLDESDETNNTATIMIPIQNTGSTGPDFSISASDLSYISKPLIPGTPVKLSAAVLNNSKSIPAKDLHVHFKINGNILLPEITVSKESLKPLQYRLVTKEWIVPANLPVNSVFEVVLDPADPDRDFPGENASDNTASVILDTYGPDLEVTADGLSWLPKEPQAGSDVTLYAGIRNAGLSPTKSNFKAKFFIDENMVGETDVPLIPGVSGFVASCSWNIPKAPELAPVEWKTLKGERGKLPLPSGATKDYKFKVQVDTGNTVAETDEDNNIAEKNLTVYVPYNKAVVYVRAFDVVGNISGAEVELKTSDGKTATTYSADNGWCTFTGVPYGSYTITISANKYIVKSITSEVKTNLVHYKEVELKRGTKEHPYFSATASTLEGITALQVDFNCTIIDPRIIDSDFYFEWRVDGNLISESKSFSQTFINTGTYEVTFYIINLNYEIVDFKSFNINVLPPEITFDSGGRILNSSGNIFLDEDLTLQDADGDGINQVWEDAAMNAANPQIELDEDEDMLTHNGHKVVNFVRISPFTSNKNRQYILFTYGITWSEDYGRYTEYTGSLLYGHNGDVEKVVMAWEVVNNKTLILRHVFTSAHSNTDTSHSGVWDPWHETEQIGKISFWPAGTVDQIMKATLEFVYISSTQSILKVYAYQH
jgi:hypothetical protein